MIKILGAILLVGVTTWMGLNASLRLRRRETTARDFASALEQLAAMMSCELLPMPDALERLSDSAPETTRSFFKMCLHGMKELGDRPFSQIWKQSLECCGAWLGGQERAVLVRAGQILGRYGLEAQLSAIGGSVHRLRSLADSSAAEVKEKGRVYTALGVCSGVMAVIVLI